jgi:hypothetical protein
MEIANRHWKSPNLSFKYHDEKGVARGYILAYEGGISQEEQDEWNSFVYISDLASDGTSRLTGGRLIKQFFEAYTSGYGGEGQKPYLPIFTNARDKTSFKIIERHANRLAQSKGLFTRIVELNTYHQGADLFHNVVVCVGKTKEELDAQEEKFKSIAQLA